MTTRTRQLRPYRARQRGVTLIIVLIALTVLLIGSVALIRSFDTATLQAGNLAFKRDLVNQGERGFAQAVATLTGEALATDALRADHSPRHNYSASTLQTDAHGVPLLLLDESAYAASGMSASPVEDGSRRIRVRYVIDRMCSETGAASESRCVMWTALQEPRKDRREDEIETPPRPVYRITVRVDGPRATRTFLQATVAL